MPEVTIKHTPAELAAMFGALDEKEQAAFFNALASYVEAEYPQKRFGFAMQMEYVRDAMDEQAPTLDVRGCEIMRIIGGNY